MTLSRKSLIMLAVLLLASPVFGVILAEELSYREPLDLVAEELGLSEAGVEWTPFRDYAVPGVPKAVGYVIAGVLGTAVIVLTCYILRKALRVG
ncbi:MAG: PDGLE domain-containing protein [Zestosphaera sp.]